MLCLEGCLRRRHRRVPVPWYSVAASHLATFTPSSTSSFASLNTATGGWNQHCATRNAHNLSLGPYINKATVKAFVRARAPQLRLAELLAYTEAAHLNYTEFVNQSYAQDLFFKTKDYNRYYRVVARHDSRS